MREARAVVRLKSEHVARVLDVGRHEDKPYMVLELLEGQDLAQILEVLQKAKASKSGKPKFVVARTLVGKGIPEVAGNYKAHGEAGAKFVDASRKLLGLPDEHFFVSDGVGACLGAHSGQDGAIVIAGTGSIGLGFVEGRDLRVGGYGFPISDEGSGADLGLKAVQLALRAHDGRYEPTALLAEVMQRFESDPMEAVAWMDRASATDYAALAPMVMRHADQGDPVGRRIVQSAAEQIDIADLAGRNPNLDVNTVKDELALVSEACQPFELEAFREGHLTPVYFGSALRNFGVGDLLEGLGRFAPPPRAQESNARKVEAAEPRMSAFVFKIQANMDPNHRDRIAFARLCSGKLTRGMKAKLVRTGKNMSLSSPQFFFAQDRALADEAFAGDVVGIPNHGTLRIGDTLTEGEDIAFVGVPSFAPEIVRRVRLTDAMKAKKLKEALQQMSEEGVVQVFRPRDGAPALVGVVGPLQLDVLKARLDAEYALPVEFEVSEFQLARWISSDDRKKLDAFVAANGSGVADDVDGDPVFLAKNEFYLNYTRERAEGIVFSSVKDVRRKG